MQQMEPDSAVYKTLLESTRAIPWKIDWASKRFTYVGPQIEELLGWTPASWATVNEWAERMHPEDREWVVDFCVAQSLGGIDHEADYRALCSDGSYVWIRDVVHVVRNNGEVESLVGFMFDISERKRGEEELRQLRDRLEALSFCDGLTGLANRRRLDQVLEREGASAARNGQPVSLILADVDKFKEYNDHYGHLAGDECLKQLAAALESCATRPRDLVARYGGEEFVLILPETDNEAAWQVAEQCKQAVLDACIPHAASSVGAWLTISLGVVTSTPAAHDSMQAALGQVDLAMYRAKQQGRNRIAACG
ncbi:MAG: diguanylate cyclase [Xanthomonadales bacterium]|nr:diguanylate cyclase [Xanthomonadales bacterium]